MGFHNSISHLDGQVQLQRGRSLEQKIASVGCIQAATADYPEPPLSICDRHSAQRHCRQLDRKAGSPRGLKDQSDAVATVPIATLRSEANAQH
jgi:hypothetical protein